MAILWVEKPAVRLGEISCKYLYILGQSLMEGIHTPFHMKHKKEIAMSRMKKQAK